MLSNTTFNYSVDMIKKASFVDELNNVLRLIHETEMPDNLMVVMKYLEARIAEIDNKYKR